ncbi:methyl-accepting chemotaxis protein [Rhizobium sp. L1K21]|uniref:methyl-accepting chemotaxis protein n=1 Tax=Rhizobium sp. L1K21 TaxID=2954933 RepID=UPI002795E0C9|nr:methyl-accepting chemotaxis protein [Rhizobium sp. L1K21]
MTTSNQNANALSTKLEADLAKAIEQNGLDQKAIQSLKQLASLTVKAVPAGIEFGHQRAALVPELAGVMNNAEMRNAIKAAHTKRWQLVLNGDFGPELAGMTLSAANAQSSTGIDPRFHIAGYSHVLAEVVKSVVVESFSKKGFFSGGSADAQSVGEGLAAVVRAAFLDIDTVLNLYRYRNEAERAEALRKSDDEHERIRQVFGKALSSLAERDLKYRITEDLPENFKVLSNDFNHAAEQLSNIISGIDEATANILAGAEEISNATDNLSNRTEQQAASIEETAAALEEITSTVNESASRAAEAGQLVATTKDSAVHSGEVVRRAIDAMSEISHSSGEISNIIGVIDEIAFQTNLLALNAGVEAARAGDAGKGFAVVAQEVRELAQRSANAAKEIKALISKSSDQVKNGVDLVGETGKVLETIAGQVQEINTNISAIVDGAREQAVGLKEVNTAVGHMDQGTQQNAAMVEQTTAATRVLRDEIDRVAAMLQQFSTGRRGSVGSAVTGSGNFAASAPKAAAPRTEPAPAPVRKASLKTVTADTPPPKFGNRPPAPARHLDTIAKAFNATPAPSNDANWEEF